MQQYGTINADNFVNALGLRDPPQRLRGTPRAELLADDGHLFHKAVTVDGNIVITIAGDAGLDDTRKRPQLLVSSGN